MIQQSKIISFFLLVFALFIFTDFSQSNSKEKYINSDATKGIELVILGTLQDGGSPHTGCKKDCCKNLFDHPDPNRKVVSLGLIDHDKKHCYLFEATPDLPAQMKYLSRLANFENKETPDAIFLSHAHIGHYSGLMFLGREVMNSTDVHVYAMPRMKDYLQANGPWSQLVTLKNIQLHPMENEVPVILGKQLKVIPIRVPHRDEFSETIGFIVEGPSKSALFIPDIDKWEKWDKVIINIISKVDYAFLDGTFYSGDELNNRNIKEVPHPAITESMVKFEHLPAIEKNKICFIHFNHTNPVLNTNSPENKKVIEAGFHIASIHQSFIL